MEAIQRLAVADQEELMRRMRRRVEACLVKVMAAVNAAREGRLIDDSEVSANDLLNELKREVYQEALQARIDATEASFSPCGPGDGTTLGEQGHRLVLAAGAAGAGSDQASALPAAGAGGAQQRQPAGCVDRRGGPGDQPGGSGGGVPAVAGRGELRAGGGVPAEGVGAGDERRNAAKAGRKRRQAGH